MPIDVDAVEQAGEDITAEIGHSDAWGKATKEIEALSSVDTRTWP